MFSPTENRGKGARNLKQLCSEEPASWARPGRLHKAGVIPSVQAEDTVGGAPHSILRCPLSPFPLPGGLNRQESSQVHRQTELSSQTQEGVA